jgi:hypothetical protein
VAAQEGSAPKRLRQWLDLLIATKRQQAAHDPELFAAYYALASQARDVVRTHVDALACQAARIIADGVARGEFVAANPAAAGRAVLYATSRFHHPANAAEWSDPGIDDAMSEVWRLLANGLGAGERESKLNRRPRSTRRPSRQT